MKEVKRARKEEIRYMEGRKLWMFRPLTECWEKTGKDPVTMKWVDTNKGDEKNPVYRRRLVAKEFNDGKEGGEKCKK